MAAEAARIEHLSKRFGRQEVLRDISLLLPHGQITGLLGPSGCGKTTLVNLMVNITRPSSGTVSVLGESPPLKTARMRLGFMPQSEALYNDLTATENLRFFGALFGLRGTSMTAAIERVLNLVHLKDEGRKLVADFSGGMKRRLSLAVALLHQPELLLLDEPTVGLDPVHRLELWEAFRQLADTGTALLITTHVMDEAASCDNIVMMRDGLIIAQDSPAALIERTGTDNLEAAFLIFARAQGESASADEKPGLGSGDNNA
jgi:ABC-2 type transport system ATP-binding protein